MKYPTLNKVTQKHLKLIRFKPLWKPTKNFMLGETYFGKAYVCQ